MRILAYLSILAGCAAEPAPVPLASDLAMPLDVALDRDTVYALQYDGSIVAAPLDGTPIWEVVPREREVAANEIAVEPGSYNLLVDGDTLYWTSNATGIAAVHRATLVAGARASGPVVLDTSTRPFPELARVGDRVCWSTVAGISCVGRGGTVVAPLLTGRGHPSAFVEAAGVLYFVEPGDGRRASNGALLAMDLQTNEVRELATSLHAPGGVVLQGDRLYWLDDGSCTATGSLCTGNHDASLHSIGLTSGGVVLEHGGFGAITSDDLVVAGDAVWFDADGRLWSDGPGIAHDQAEIANVSCNALAATATEVLCASDGAGTLHGELLAVPY